MNEDPDLSTNGIGRRTFIKTAGLISAGFVATTAAVASVAENWSKITTVGGVVLKKLDQRVKKSILSSILVPDAPFKLFAGKTNILAHCQGKDGLSSFLKGASEEFLSVIKAATDNLIENKADPNSKEFEWDPYHEVLLLGGPVANKETAFLCGYKYIDVLDDEGKLVPMPVFDHDERFRWAFFVGDSGYGKKNGIKFEAKRFDNNPNKIDPVKRAQYGLYDMKYNRVDPIFFEKNRADFLVEEALIITRLANPTNQKRFATAVGGVHGYSTEAFARDIVRNLDELKNLVGSVPSYQVCVPVRLEHKNSFTNGQLEWKKAELHKIIT
jgi:hypothetical protein